MPKLMVMIMPILERIKQKFNINDVDIIVDIILKESQSFEKFEDFYL